MNQEGFEAPGYLVAPAELPVALQFVAATTVFYLSSHGYTSQHGDAPADTHFEGRLVSPFSFGRSVIDSQDVSGQVALSLGTIEIWNGDDFYTSLVNGYAIDGRTAVLKRGSALSIAYSSFSSLFSGMGAGWSINRETISLQLADMTWRLNVALQTTLYGGNGGTDGTANLAGLPKPIVLGEVKNITPVLVDPVNGVYQVNWRAVRSIYTVREAGLPITQVVSSPGLGQWSPNNAAGTFTLGYSPSGQITCDVQGDAGGTGYDPSIAGILKKLLKDLGAGLQDSDLDLTAFAQLAQDVPGVCGWFQDDTVTTVTAALGAVIQGIVGYVGANRSNQISPGIVKSPLTTPAFTLQEEDIVAVTQVDPPSSFFPPPERIRVGYQTNWSPSNLLAGSISDADRAFLQTQYSIASAFSNTVAAAYLAAQDPAVFPTILLNQSDAQARANQLLDLYAPAKGSRRRFFQIVTGRYLGQIELGYTGEIFHPDFALSGGFLGSVVAWSEDAAAGLVTITLCG